MWKARQRNNEKYLIVLNYSDLKKIINWKDGWGEQGYIIFVSDNTGQRPDEPDSVRHCRTHVIPILNQSATFVGSVGCFLNVCTNTSRRLLLAASISSLILEMV
jgi:hypothetical protein